MPRTPGTSGFTWVIDPIDGTTNFINGIPAWTVVLAGVADGQTQVGVIHDPVHDETFSAVRGAGARLNGQPLALGGHADACRWHHRDRLFQPGVA